MMSIFANFMKILVSTGLITWLAWPPLASAQDKGVEWFELDCTAMVVEERERLLAAEEAITLEYMGAFIDSCMLANSTAKLEAVELQVSAARVRLAAIDLRIDEKGRLLNELNQEIGQLERTNDGLRIRIDESRGRQNTMLRQAEAILQNLARQ